MSDFRGILRGTFISDQYHFRKYRACFSPFHCFDNSSIASDQSLLFRKEIPISTFFRNTRGNVITPMPLLFLNPLYSQSSLGEDLVWEDSCRSFCGAAGGSGTHCNPLSWPLSQLETKVTTLWPSGQWILWAWSFKSGWDWTLPARSLISQPLSQELYLHPAFGLWGPRAPSVCPAPLEREGKPSIHAPKVCLPWSAPLYLMAHPWSILAWVSLMVIC